MFARRPSATLLFSRGQIIVGRGRGELSMHLPRRWWPSIAHSCTKEVVASLGARTSSQHGASRHVLLDCGSNDHAVLLPALRCTCIPALFLFPSCTIPCLGVLSSSSRAGVLRGSISSIVCLWQWRFVRRRRPCLAGGRGKVRNGVESMYVHTQGGKKLRGQNSLTGVKIDEYFGGLVKQKYVFGLLIYYMVYEL